MNFIFLVHIWNKGCNWRMTRMACRKQSSNNHLPPVIELTWRCQRSRSSQIDSQWNGVCPKSSSILWSIRTGWWVKVVLFGMCFYCTKDGPAVKRCFQMRPWDGEWPLAKKRVEALFDEAPGAPAQKWSIIWLARTLWRRIWPQRSYHSLVEALGLGARESLPSYWPPGRFLVRNLVTKMFGAWLPLNAAHWGRGCDRLGGSWGDTGANKPSGDRRTLCPSGFGHWSGNKCREGGMHQRVAWLSRPLVEHSRGLLFPLVPSSRL